jgi:DNA-binding LytR/AlgR family response regulator
MQVLNCLIVEDEPLAARVISDYVAQIPSLHLAAVCEDAFSAMEKLKQESISVIFMDINLPKLSGVDFTRILGNKYHIIFTTAYHQYALESYELNVVDYLMKPVEFSRFLQAVNKLPIEKENSGEKKHYFFNVDKIHVKVLSDEILYIESLKDYVRIHCPGKSIVTKFPIGELENYLGADQFLRIHKSYIVNTAKVTSYTASLLSIASLELPVGRTYREQVDKVFKKRD